MKKYLLLLIAFVMFVTTVSASVIYVPPAGAAGATAGGSIFSWISNTASSANAGLDQVYYSLISIGTYIQTIPNSIYLGLMAVMMGLFFPFVDAINYLYNDINFLYESFVPMANMLLGAPQWSLGFIYNWTPSHAPTVTDSALASLSSNTVYQAWIVERHVESTAYVVASVALLLIAITINFLLRFVRFAIWVYKKIPVIGGE